MLFRSMKERLSLLGSVDPYTGRYFSQKWIQRNVLRLTDDEIEAMQAEIEEEKEEGLGLPTDVTTQVAQAQMMGDVQMQQQAQQAELQNAMQPQQKPQQTKEEKPDLSLENNSFTKLKRIL